MVLFYTWNLKNVTCLFLIPQTSLLLSFVFCHQKNLSHSVFFLNIITITLSFGWKRTILEYFHPSGHLNQCWLAFLPCLTYHEIWKVNWCFFDAYCGLCLFLSHRPQNLGDKQIQDGIIDHLSSSSCKSLSVWPHPSLWTALTLSEPAESLSNDIQIVCLSHALGQPLLDSAPPFPNWLLLCQYLSWELSTLTAHLSSRCSGQKPSSDFICLHVLCCA